MALPADALSQRGMTLPADALAVMELVKNRDKEKYRNDNGVKIGITFY